jgi:hypothetical protein
MAMLSPCLAWGQKGHRMAAEASLQALPPELRAWYAGKEAEYADAALEPDRRKSGDRKEGPRHFLNSEVYGDLDHVPLEAQRAVAIGGAQAFARGGQLPWVIGDRYRSLVEAFRSKDRDRVVADSGWLCHYVADAQVPLHTTRNHDGQESGQKGVHSRWESGLVERKVESPPVHRTAQLIPDPFAAPFAWLVRAHDLVTPLLAADRKAQASSLPRKPGLPLGPDYWSRFWALQGPTLEGQLKSSAECSADLLLTAWEAAGRPPRP